MLRIIMFTLLTVCSATCICQENAVDVIKLHKVIAEFEESIKLKDSIRFKKIFFDEAIPFIGIMSEKTEMSIKKDYPDFQGIAVSNYKKFIMEICESDKKQIEKFYNIKIDTDQSIASISFDYSFHSDDKMIQWGHEKWNLVKAEGQWFITDVIYSIHFPDIEVFPYAGEK